MDLIRIARIKKECIEFSANEGLTIHELNISNFKASDSEVIVNVPIDHLVHQEDQGHSVEDTLRNELCIKGDS